MALKHVWITTILPSDRDPVGAVEIGYYTVEDGILQMVSEAGKPAGKKFKLQPGDDPQAIAARLTKEAWMKRARESDFHREIIYPPRSIA
jgi:hypothetical protein